MKKGKVLHVINNMDPKLGGVSQAVRTMIAGLENVNKHSEVVTLNSSDAYFLQEDTFPTHTLGPSIGLWSYSSRLTPWLIDNLPRFDTVILHGLWLFNGYALYKAMEVLRKEKHTRKVPRLFIMPHGMLDPYFQKSSSRKLKAIRNWAYWKLIEANVVNKADGLLFTCDEERLLAKVPFKPYQPMSETVVGLGVEAPPAFTEDMQNAFHEKCPELQGQPYILFISRIHEKKGVNLLIKAYAELANKFKAPQAFSYEKSSNNNSIVSKTSRKILPKLVIAGPGLDTPYGIQMQQLVTEVGLKNSIYFTGMLTGKAKWGAFYGCETFILPSHQENLGIAVVEALACSKPVLISNKINIWREIEQIGGGFIADNTQIGITTLLEKWQNVSVEESERMRNSARMVYEEHFSIQPNISKLLKAINLLEDPDIK